MVSIARETPDVCQLLREDPELAEAIAPARRQQAIEDCRARVIELGPGTWDGGDSFSVGAGLGLLMLDGLLIRRVGIDSRFGAELLGEGDVLRPWQTEASHTLPITTGWMVPQTARLAVLDQTFTSHVAMYPELAACLLSRAIQRVRNLGVNMAIVHHARVDDRLHMLLWHMAGRWGRVRADGTVLPMRLTHSLLSELVAAQRPTVTTAMADLARRGLVRSNGREWVLPGAPPGELLDLGAATPQSGPASASAGHS